MTSTCAQVARIAVNIETSRLRAGPSSRGGGCEVGCELWAGDGYEKKSIRSDLLQLLHVIPKTGEEREK